MDVGMSLFFQSPGFHEEGAETGELGPRAGPVSDAEVYRHNLELAEMAEPLGFDSLWTVEHHFTGYTMVPDPTQVLAYLAARTTTIKLGSMVIVLPWHHPVRITESIASLDILCGGRFLLGIGRGLGRIEFEGLGVPMGESRERFVEMAEIVLGALETGYVEYAGRHYRIPKRMLRPEPLRSFQGRRYSAAVSPESIDIVARLGLGLVVLPQKPWATIADELELYRARYEEINGEPAPPPIVGCHVYCHEDPAVAAELGQLYITRYYHNALKHYELAGDHFSTTKDYEYYEQTANRIQTEGEERSLHWFSELQVFGTPDECVEKIAHIQELTGTRHFLGIFSYSGMPEDDAVRNLMAFSDKIQPRLRAM